MSEQLFRLSERVQVVEVDQGDMVFHGNRYSPVLFQGENIGLRQALEALPPAFTADEAALLGFEPYTVDLLLSRGVFERHDEAVDPPAPAAEAQQPASPGTSEAKPRRIVNLTYLIEQGCNLGCVYCLNGKDSYRVEANPSMSTETAIQTIDQIRAVQGEDVELNVSFFGGEPMIGWKKIITIMDAIAERFSIFSFDMTTNLTLLPAPFVKKAKEYGLRFAVNIDGPEPIHDALRPYLGGRGSFEKICANIHRLIDAGCEVTLRMVLTRLNQRHIRETLDLHRQLGAKASIITLMRSSDSDGTDIDSSLYPEPDIVWQEMADLIESRIKSGQEIDFFPAIDVMKHLESGTRLRQYCGANFESSAVIEESGRVFNCVWFVGNEAHLYGSDYASAVADGGAKQEEFTRLARINSWQPCSRCNYRELCGGPCPATKIMGKDRELLEQERRVKCAVMKPVVNGILLALASGQSVSRVRNYVPANWTAD